MDRSSSPSERGVYDEISRPHPQARGGYIELRPANDAYPVFKIREEDHFEVWGVVVHLIRTFEKA